MKKSLDNLIGRLTKAFDSRAGQIVALAGSLTLFTGLCLSNISSASIWFDEAFSAYLTKYNLAEIAHYTALDVHPPLYYWFLKGWSSLFGTSEAAFRSMSVLFGVITIILVYILIRKLFNHRTAAYSVLLLAISPLFIRYGIEARMYTMVSSITLAATLILQKALETKKRKYYVIYGILVSLGMWTHYFTVLVWLSHWAYRLVWFKHRGFKGHELARSFFSKNWILAHIIAVGLFLPWLPIAVRQFTSVSGGFWIPPVTVNTPGDFITDILFYMESGQADGWFAVTAALIVGLIIYLAHGSYQQSRTKSQKTKLALVFLMALLPITLLIILSLYPLKSAFVDRYILTSVIFITVLCAVVIVNFDYRRLKLGWLGYVASIAIIAAFSFGTYRVISYSHDSRSSREADHGIGSRDLMRQIKGSTANVPVIAANGYIFYELVFYQNNQNPVYISRDKIKDDQTGSLQMIRDNKFNENIDDLVKFSKNHSSVWVVDTVDGDRVDPPQGANGWQVLRTIEAYSPTGSSTYKATEYKTD